MDASFDQFGGGGWGEPGDEFTSATQAPHKSMHEKIPIPVAIDTLVAKSGDDDEKYTIGSYSFNLIRVMGKIASVSTDSIQSNYELCDAMANDSRTAKRFSLVHHYAGDSSHDREDVYNVGQIVQAVGKLRLFNNRLSMFVFNLREVEMDEIVLFKLECKLAIIYYEKKILEHSLGDVEKDTVFQRHASAEPATPSRSTNAFGGMAKSQMGMGGSRLPPGTQTHQMGSASENRRQVYQQSQAPAHHLTPQQQMIYDYISRNTTGEDGVHVEQIKRALKPNPKFGEDMHLLLSEGVIYSTVDEEHFSII